MKIYLIIIPLITVIVALSGSFVTSRGMDWYNQINLPAWTPSGDIIGIAWTLIFILATYSAILFWNRGFRNKRFWIVIALFLLNGALNALWSFLFFGLHFVGASILEMIALETTIICLIFLIKPTSRLASILLYPYAIWVAFATYLAYSILMLNM
ncbi:tryptophan-rich sensory protein [Patescibacteria group bacterium]|nr:tryptophan-rich sensory protein [Patescibacteria group bacterium]MBU4162176.1 tryptophan-rich sensory protein [Patescibacteria group bacterium]